MAVSSAVDFRIILEKPAQIQRAVYGKMHLTLHKLLRLDMHAVHHLREQLHGRL